MVYYIVSVLFLLFLSGVPAWRLINVSVQYNGGLLPDIILLTQFYYHRGTRLNAMKRFCISYIVSVLFLLFLSDVPAWRLINVSVQYNGGLLPDIILLTQFYYHRGTRLNAMKRFCICSL